MSRQDVQRFSEALRRDPSLEAEFRDLGQDPQAWQKHALARGYRLTLDEISGLSGSYRELDEDEIEQVAGGWDDGESTGGEGDGG